MFFYCLTYYLQKNYGYFNVNVVEDYEHEDATGEINSVSADDLYENESSVSQNLTIGFTIAGVVIAVLVITFAYYTRKCNCMKKFFFRFDAGTETFYSTP